MELVYLSFANVHHTNLITSCLFMLDNGYKNFNKYMIGLESIALNYKRYLPTFLLRLYIDDSIVDSVYYNKILTFSKHIQIVRFNAPQYKKNNRHIDLFPTLVRFYPLFDYSDNFTKHVICIDLDNGITGIERISNQYKTFFRSCSKFQYEPMTILSAKCKWWDQYNFAIVAHNFASKIHFPHKIFEDFLAEMLRKKYPALDYKKYKTYPYGIDELFVNQRLLPHITKSNMLYNVVFNYDITRSFYELKKHDIIRLLSKPDKKILLLTLQYVLASKSNNVDKMILEFDAVLYGDIRKKKCSETNKALVSRYNETMLSWYKKAYNRIFPMMLVYHNVLNAKYLSAKIVYYMEQGSIVRISRKEVIYIR